MIFAPGLACRSDVRDCANRSRRKQYADVSAYFASLPGLPENRGERTPRPHRQLSQPRILCKGSSMPGDPKRRHRGMAPSCHGPGGYRIGAPALAKQTNCILSSSCKHLLWAHAPTTWTCRCERSPVRFTESEIRALARAYAKRERQRAVKKKVSEKRGLLSRKGEIFRWEN